MSEKVAERANEELLEHYIGEKAAGRENEALCKQLLAGVQRF
ncbi:hypothetical protein [Paenibacillus silvisoli]|nr:hypothetical protein [Paenibacillus silvisoli]